MKRSYKDKRSELFCMLQYCKEIRMLNIPMRVDVLVNVKFCDHPDAHPSVVRLFGMQYRPD